MTQTVTPNEPTDQPDHFADIAAALRDAADRISDLIGSGLPEPAQFQLNIQPGEHGDDDGVRRSVDAVTSALLGHGGRVQKMGGGGGYHYNNGDSHEPLGAVTVRIYQSVSAEWAVKREAAAKLAEREAELEKLRAEVAELRAAASQSVWCGGGCTQVADHPGECDPDATGLGYSREADDPTPVSPERVPLHTGAVVDGGQLVDETEVRPLPKCLPGCRRTDDEYGKGSSVHADGCPEWAAAKARETASAE